MNMQMDKKLSPKRHRFSMCIISYAIWRYHRFNDSYRDIQEGLAYRGIDVSHESIRSWCIKFGSAFRDVLKKREQKPNGKWHLDEMNIKINGQIFILWRAVDSDGYELDVFLQKHRDKKAAIRFLSRLLDRYEPPRVIITDKLKSYVKPIKQMMKQADHRSHKRLNNRVENAHQPTRRKEKCLIKFKSPHGVQRTLSLTGKIRNIFSVNVGRYVNLAPRRRATFRDALSIWDEASRQVLCA